MEATIDRFEGDDAILRTSDGQEIYWPSAELPDEAAEGSVLQLVVAVDGAATDDRRDQTRELLNEILNADE
ncbi:MAG: DUF3006 domain-containing protein [Patescibacteria group bacterium]|jgi:hypothetical protein